MTTNELFGRRVERREADSFEESVRELKEFCKSAREFQERNIWDMADYYDYVDHNNENC